MRTRRPIKRIFVRFFTMPLLFADGYELVEGNNAPWQNSVPDLEVKSRNLCDLDFFIPSPALGFVFYEVITTQIEDNGQVVEMTSGEINRSGRHFF